MKKVLAYLLLFLAFAFSVHAGGIIVSGFMNASTSVNASNFWAANDVCLFDSSRCLSNLTGFSFVYGNYFNQTSLNTTGNVSFNNVSANYLSGLLSYSFIVNPPWLLDVISNNSYIQVSGTTTKYLAFNEAVLNSSIDTRVSFDGYAKYDFASNNFNGSGNFSGGNITATGNISLASASSCVYLPSGGKLCGNATCSQLYSPNGLTVMQSCN